MNPHPLPAGNSYSVAVDDEVCWRGEHPLTPGEEVVRTRFGRVACAHGFWRFYGIDHATGEHIEGQHFDDEGVRVVPPTENQAA